MLLEFLGEELLVQQLLLKSAWSARLVNEAGRGCSGGGGGGGSRDGGCGETVHVRHGHTWGHSSLLSELSVHLVTSHHTGVHRVHSEDLLVLKLLLLLGSQLSLGRLH